jgi:carbamoylphosphate synthase small subunit
MKLLLEDGSEFEGLAFGADRPVVGEVVFTTAMSGYVESLTDPSFRGQIPEVIQKAVRMLDIGVPGVDPDFFTEGDVREALRCPRRSGCSPSRGTLRRG